MAKVLLVGSGGREHALAWKIAQSPHCEKLHTAPGNAGTGELGENVPIAVTDIAALLKFALENKIDLTVVGPDDPLALGIVNEFREAGLLIFGPTKAAARIEASKTFAKDFMVKYAIPTARFASFKEYEEARKYLTSQPVPVVIKASGLALGKGVFVCGSLAEAETALKAVMVDKVCGEAGSEVVIEEFLEGQEVSIHAFSDGVNYKIFPTAQDHKPIFDGDKGPNTGGMGTIAPLPWVSPETLKEIEERIVRPALTGLAEEGAPFAGVIYPGLKMTEDGPKVLEFNARFGDPETQSYMRLLRTDVLEIMEACAKGTLDKVSVEWERGGASCIVLASAGYPGKYEKGKGITGIAEAEKTPGVKVFHAGTAVSGGKLVTNGGRVLGVTATGKDLKQALARAYEAADLVHFEGRHYRLDIGAKSF